MGNQPRISQTDGLQFKCSSKTFSYHSLYTLESHLAEINLCKTTVNDQ